jgi:sulfur-oxidizing protein SoxX
MRRIAVAITATLVTAHSGAATDVQGPDGVRYRIDGDGVSAPIAAAGDPQRGAALAYGRESACTLCHRLPPRAADPDAPQGGDIGPPLAGSGGRLSVAQLRLRLIDPQRLDPQSVMPAYFRTEGLRRVAGAYDGRPVFDAQQIEDVVAWLATL